MTAITLQQGKRYAVGITIPLLARAYVTDLVHDVDATGMHALTDSEMARTPLGAAGWQNVIIYRADAAPIVPPEAGADYIAIGTHTGPAEPFDVDNMQPAGFVRWIVEVTPAIETLGQGAGRTGTPIGAPQAAGDTAPLWGVGLALLAVLGVAAVALSGDRSR